MADGLTFQVVVPDDVVPGETYLEVEVPASLPGGGTPLRFIVPSDCEPGDVVDVPVPAAVQPGPGYSGGDRVDVTSEVSSLYSYRSHTPSLPTPAPQQQQQQQQRPQEQQQQEQGGQQQEQQQQEEDKARPTPDAPTPSDGGFKTPGEGTFATPATS